MNNEPMDIEKFSLSSEAFMDARILDQLDDVKELCVAFVEKPFVKEAQPLTEAVAAHLAAVRIVLDQIDDKTDSPENVDEMLSYVNGLDAMRVTFLKDICDQDTLESIVGFIEDDELDDDESDEESGSLTDDIFQMYKQGFQKDLQVLSAIGASEYEGKPSTKRKRMLKKVGHHALGVAKIAGGVVAGLAIVKKSKLF